MARRYTDADILDYLDNCVVYSRGAFFFMDLEHPYFYTANSRLSLFANDTDWAIVFEKSGYANRSSRIEVELNFFGSTLRNLEPAGEYQQRNFNSKYFSIVDWENALSEVSSETEEVSLSAGRVRLRSQYVDIPRQKEGYLKWVPDILTRSYPPNVSIEDLARYLAFEYEPLCRATVDELRTCLPEGIPLLMQIDAWHHRSYGFYENGPIQKPTGEPPSSYETFPLIAEVLYRGDPDCFRPTLPPTNHWSHWPDTGSL